MAIATNLVNLSAKDTLHCCGADLKNGQRGLNEQWIKAGCSSSFESEYTEDLKVKGRGDGIRIEGENGVVQIRLHKPFRDKKGKLVRYLSESKVEGGGYDALLPKHPEDPNYWKNIELLKKHCHKVYKTVWSYTDAGGNRVEVQDPSKSALAQEEIVEIPLIMITEGGFKAIAACSHGYPTIALLGVEMGLTPSSDDPQGKRYLVNTLEKYAKVAVKHGFGFLLAFDADSYTNPQVASALLKLGDQLQKFGNAGVPVYCLPQWKQSKGKGIDDYIVNNGIEEFRKELLGRSLLFSDWQSEYSPGKGSKLPKPDKIARELAEKYKDKWIYCEELSSWLAYELNEKGIYGFVSDKYIEVQIKNILKARGIEGYGSYSYIENIRKNLQAELFELNWKVDLNLLPFLDCVLDINSGKVRKHSPDNRSLWVLPRNYQGSAVVPSSWGRINGWLDEATQGNEKHKRLILCFAAAILRRRGDLQKFMHLIGIGGSGKGVLSTLLTNLVGESNCAFLSIEDLNEKDAIADLFGKALIVFNDQDPVGKKIAQFKRLTGHDRLRGRHLFKSAFYFRFDGLCLVTSNKQVFNSGSGKWLFRRAIPIPFNCEPKTIRNLEKEFDPELSAFTNYLLSIPEEEVEAVLRGEGVEQSLSVTFWETQTRSDGLASWVNDCLIQDPMAKTQIGSNSKEWISLEYDPYNSTLFGSYNHHSRQTNRSPLTKENFSGDLLELLKHVLGWKVEKRKSNGRMHIVGVRLRRDEDRDIPYIDETLAQGESQGQDRGENGENPKPNQEEAQGQQGEILATKGSTSIVEDNNDENNLSSPKDSHDPNDSHDHQNLVKDIKNNLEAAQNPTSVSPPSPTKSGVGFGASPTPSPAPSPEASPNSPTHRTYPVTKDSPLEIFEEYPHYWTEDLRAKRNGAIAIKNQILECSSSEELDRFRNDGKYNDKQINWVWHNILTGAEKGRIEAIAKTEQLELDFSLSSPEWEIGATVLSSDRTLKGLIEKLDGDRVEVNWEDGSFSSTFREQLILLGTPA